MTIRHAACSCGQLSVIVHGEPVRISVCHCLECQRRTGSAFGAQARFRKADVEIRGASTAYRRIADSGNAIRFHFCPTCGSTIYYQSEDQPELVAVPVGAFADPDFPAPWVSVYESRKHSWVGLPDGIEHHE
ncbi:MAG TPA: GFA family protein [Thermoanaerobaculales bacterium]|nr:GFA family protein [Thermoanaerobaculales bacterium]